VLVGREREQRALCAAIEAAASGCGQVVLLSGEPGIGKTRLAEEAATQAAAFGMRSCWARASDDAGSPPYWLFRQLLGCLEHAAVAESPSELSLVAPDLRSAGGAVAVGYDEADRFRAFQAVRSMLGAAAEPDGMLLILDDLQWADPSSLQLLVHVARDIAQTRLVLVATYRDTELAGRVALQQTLMTLAREATVTALGLSGLVEPGVAAQLAEISGGVVSQSVVRAVTRRTNGNPFFVAELGRLIEEGPDDSQRIAQALPAGLRDAVRGRLAQLSPACRRLMAIAAVVGSTLDPGVLAAMAATDLATVMAAVDEATAAGILTRPAGWRFMHDLIRDTARLDLTTTERLSAHDRVAAVLSGRADAVSQLAEIAFHAVASLPLGDATRAAVVAERAAAGAAGQLAWDQAASLYGQAVTAAFAGSLPVADRCRLLLAQARAQVRGYDIDGARQSLLTVVDLARDSGDVGTIAAAALVMEGVTEPLWAGTGAGLCEEALAGLPDEDTPLRARLLAQLAVHRQLSEVIPDQEAVGRLSESALAMAERTGDHEALVAALRARQAARSGPDGAAERLALGNRMAAVGTNAQDDDVLLWGLLWRFDAVAQLGRVEEAEAELSRLAAVAGRLRSPMARWHLMRCRGAVAIGRGRLDEAYACGQEQVELARRAGHGRAHVPSVGFLIYVCCLTGAAELPQDVPVEASWDPATPLYAMTGAWHLAMGRREAARQVYLSVPPDLPVADFILLPALAWAADLAAAFEDVPRCVEVYRRLLPFADLFVCGGAGAVAIWGTVQLPLGVAAAGAGRMDDAVRHLRAAAQINEQARLPPFAATARYQLAQVLARRGRSGDREDASALAAAAAAEAERLGMAPLSRAASELAASLAGRRSGPLTARERDVAVLVSQGLTNRQIAALRHLSERTVENHVQHICTKLGFHNRTQIAAWVAAGENMSTPVE